MHLDAAAEAAAIGKDEDALVNFVLGLDMTSVGNAVLYGILCAEWSMTDGLCYHTSHIIGAPARLPGRIMYMLME